MATPLSHLPRNLQAAMSHTLGTPGRPVGSSLARPAGANASHGLPTPASASCGCGSKGAPMSRGGGGRTVEVCPPRDFTFTNLGLGLSQTVLVAERIDCSAYETVDLIVRVHTDATMGAGSTISVEVVPDGFTSDDPAQPFYGGVLGNAPVTFITAPSAGDIEVKTYTSGLGAMLAVRVVGDQANNAGTDVTARLSIELALREC